MKEVDRLASRMAKEVSASPDREALIRALVEIRDLNSVHSSAVARETCVIVDEVLVMKANDTDVDKLANFIMGMDEPSRDEGAVDTAIRVICRLQRECAFLNSCALCGEVPTAAGLKAAGDIGDADARSWS